MDISSEPDFAIICSFLAQFGEQIDVKLNIDQLEEWLLDQDKIDENLIDLHVRLIKKVRRYFVRDQWEKVLIKFAAPYSFDHAVELETYGYLKTNPVTRLVLLRCLVDAQFDNGDSEFKANVNSFDADELRQKPIGRDLTGNTYWKTTDLNGNFRIYKEEPQKDDSWLEICRLPNEMAYLIEDLDKIKNEKCDQQEYNERLENHRKRSELLQQQQEELEEDLYTCTKSKKKGKGKRGPKKKEESNKKSSKNSRATRSTRSTRNSKNKKLAWDKDDSDLTVSSSDTENDTEEDGQDGPDDLDIDKNENTRSSRSKRKVLRTNGTKIKSEEDEEEEVKDKHEDEDDEFACEDEDSALEPVIIRKVRTRLSRSTQEMSQKSDTDANSSLVLLPTPYDDEPCNLCGKSDEPDLILLCDMCDIGCHTKCCIPPLYFVPDGDWYCRICEHSMLLENLRSFNETILELRAAYEIEMRKLRRKVVKREPMIKATPLKLCAPLRTSRSSRLSRRNDTDSQEDEDEEDFDGDKNEEDNEEDNIGDIAMIEDDGENEVDGERKQKKRVNSKKKRQGAKNRRSSEYSSGESEYDEIVEFALKAKRKKEMKLKQLETQQKELESLPSKRTSRSKISYADLNNANLGLDDEEDEEAIGGKSSDESLHASDESFKVASEVETEVEDEVGSEEDDDDATTEADEDFDSSVSMEDELLQVTKRSGKKSKKKKRFSKSSSKKSKSRSKATKKSKRKKRDEYSDDEDDDDDLTVDEWDSEEESDDQQEEELSRSKRRAVANRASYREEPSDLDDETGDENEDADAEEDEDDDDRECGAGKGKGKSIENLLPSPPRKGKRSRRRSSDEESHQSWRESPPKSDLGIEDEDDEDNENENDVNEDEEEDKEDEDKQVDDKRVDKKSDEEDTPTDISDSEAEPKKLNIAIEPDDDLDSESKPLTIVEDTSEKTSIASNDSKKISVKHEIVDTVKPRAKSPPSNNSSAINKISDVANTNIAVSKTGQVSKDNAKSKKVSASVTDSTNASATKQSPISPAKSIGANPTKVDPKTPCSPVVAGAKQQANPMQALDRICAPTNTSYKSGMQHSLDRILNKPGACLNDLSAGPAAVAPGTTSVPVSGQPVVPVHPIPPTALVGVAPMVAATQQHQQHYAQHQPPIQMQPTSIPYPKYYPPPPPPHSMTSHLNHPQHQTNGHLSQPYTNNNHLHSPYPPYTYPPYATGAPGYPATMPTRLNAPPQVPPSNNAAPIPNILPNPYSSPKTGHQHPPHSMPSPTNHQHLPAIPMMPSPNLTSLATPNLYNANYMHAALQQSGASQLILPPPTQSQQASLTTLVRPPPPSSAPNSIPQQQTTTQSQQRDQQPPKHPPFYTEL